MTDITNFKLAIHEKLNNDLKFYAQKALFIKTSGGSIEPFVFNRAQEYLHAELEKQLQDTGMVRAIVIKGRQQGISTYIAARFLHKAVWNPAKSVFILSHHAATTETLYGMVERYYLNCPDILKPKLVVNNRRRLQFANNSQYTVGTAGSGSIGRGDTNQYFHGSEVAFYENTDDIQTGVLQTVADIPGTEIILESTANGIGNFFHQACMDAMEGKGRFRLIFIPWYWEPRYRAAVPQNFEITDDEETLQKLYSLDAEQLYWRRLKIQDFKSEWKFKQEYPFTVKEAFQSSGNSLIDPILIQKARKANVPDPNAAVIMGVDPARKGDRTVIAIRQGRQVIKTIIYNDMDEMRLAGIVGRFIGEYRVKKCFIDYGLGYGTVDRLVELGYGSIVTGVQFGGAAIDDSRFANKRAEMAGSLKDWFEQEIVDIPDDEETEVDILSIPEFKESSSGRFLVEPKDNIRKKSGRSPDIFDALCLTFAFPVNNVNIENNGSFYKYGQSAPKSPFKTRQRIESKGKQNGSTSSRYHRYS